MKSSVIVIGGGSAVPRYRGNLGGLTTGYQTLLRNPHASLAMPVNRYGNARGIHLPPAANSLHAPGVLRYGDGGLSLGVGSALRGLVAGAVADEALKGYLALNQLAWNLLLSDGVPSHTMRGGYRIGPLGNVEIFSRVYTYGSNPVHLNPDTNVTVAAENRAWWGLGALSGVWIAHFPISVPPNPEPNTLQKLYWQLTIDPYPAPVNVPFLQPNPLASPYQDQSPWQDTDLARRNVARAEMFNPSAPFVLDMSRTGVSGGFKPNTRPPRGVKEDKVSSKRFVRMLSVVESGGDLGQLLVGYYNAAVETAKQNGHQWKSWSRASWFERYAMLGYGITYGFDAASLNSSILRWGLGEMAGRYVRGYDAFRGYHIDRINRSMQVI